LGITTTEVVTGLFAKGWGHDFARWCRYTKRVRWIICISV